MAPKGLDPQTDHNAEALESKNKANAGINPKIGPEPTNFEELQDVEIEQKRLELLESFPKLELIADSGTPLEVQFREDIAVLLHEIAAYCLYDSKPDSTQMEQAYKASILYLMSYFAYSQRDIDPNSDRLIKAELNAILAKLTPQHGNAEGEELERLFDNKIWTLLDGIDSAKAGALNGIILVAIKAANLNYHSAANESVPSIATRKIFASLGLAIP